MHQSTAQVRQRYTQHSHAEPWRKGRSTQSTQAAVTIIAAAIVTIAAALLQQLAAITQPAVTINPHKTLP